MGPLRNLWLRWKMLRLPWRKTFLVGQDLQGNTFWEFKDTLNTNRFRRIVRSNDRRTHYGDVQVSPLWHQWLRQTRAAPPTVQEQHGDIVRLSQLRQNARLADQRWASKAKYIESPKPQARQTSSGAPELQKRQATIAGGDTPTTEPAAKEGVRSAVDTKASAPSEVTGSNPGSAWQPEAWLPGALKR